MNDWQPLHFIGEPITVGWDEAPVFSKRPGCPDRFEWQGKVYTVTELLREHSDYTRRGRFANNMRPEHAEAASERGSWGVGRTYFVVQVEDGRVFELYYDRAPQGARRAGTWFLYQEMGRSPDA